MPVPATSAGMHRYGFEAVSAVKRRAEFSYIVLLNAWMEPRTTVSLQRSERVEGTSSGPTTEANAPLRQTTGEAILELRRRSGLTWELLSDLFNVSRRTVHHWANGKAPSAPHERDIRWTLDAVRHLDEGNRRATRDRLLTTVQGTSPYDLLADRRYEDVLGQTPGVASDARMGHRTALSEEEQVRRRPTRPHLLLEAIQDRPAIPAGSSRIIRPARRNKSTE